jgi:hypothetical protein
MGIQKEESKEWKRMVFWKAFQSILRKNLTRALENTP